jgi:hypothetical protein
VAKFLPSPICIVNERYSLCRSVARFKILGIPIPLVNSTTMKKPRNTRPEKALAPSAAGSVPGKIHPVVIYPFREPPDHSNLEQLYGLVALLDAKKDKYARPITVVDRKTYFANAKSPRFLEFRKSVVSGHSDILDAWCVDTCQMWYTGLGHAFERGTPADVYWLIPGDFDYGTAAGKEVLGRLHDLPEICLECQQDICIGEIATTHEHPKHLIDTYGTFALLYNWFPAEAREIRQFTERPRSEFFAVRHDFLRDALNQRWFAYEQTVVILLQSIWNQKRVSRFLVGNISDLPEGREPFSSAVQQIERTERVLKTLWRERRVGDANWSEEYRRLERRSEELRRSAFVVLEKLLI